MTEEHKRLREDATRVKNWKRWGPYLAERQWGTVREDYSENGTCWDYFPHDHARSRAYRWGEDGLLGICDRECRLCFALALWNGKDPILKERLFGLSGPEGNHGEDVKEEYFYLDSTPTHSYLKALYKYPQDEFPYRRLVEENRRRGRGEPEFELADTGIFAESRYFDVVAEYAKNSPNDILIRITVTNRGPAPSSLHLLPTLWFRNTWTWSCTHEGCTMKPRIQKGDGHQLATTHESLERFFLVFEPNDEPLWLFTENETNFAKLFGVENNSPYVKDAFHSYVIDGRRDAVNPRNFGTKAALHYRLDLPPSQSRTIRLRLFSEAEAPKEPFGTEFAQTFKQRQDEADEFYSAIYSKPLNDGERTIVRQAAAGLLWSKQFYHYIVDDWLQGDPHGPPPPQGHQHGRNAEWPHLYARDVLSMPDKWEYPWFAAWDLAFHMVGFAKLDPKFAKDQLVLLLREWYMHPNGQLPAYEFAFGDVNPPVHAWAAWRVYKMSAPSGQRDRSFLESVFQKLLLNFTWWVNRKDPEGKGLFGGGFLGLDNIGLFDRSKPLPDGASLRQADGTAWMAFYCATMLSMALELASDGDRVCAPYEDMASKFLEHFVQIADAINHIGGVGMWHEEDGFYYDHLKINREVIPLRVRSMVSLLPLIAVEVLEHDVIEKLPGFYKRFQWFLKHRRDLKKQITYCESAVREGQRLCLLAIPSRERLRRTLAYMLDENEFLSSFGIRSLSKFHLANPVVYHLRGAEYRVDYVPGESITGLFGGNSNWRGPIWMPVNYLLIEALERYHHFYGDTLQVECPTGSGRKMNLKQVSMELTRRLTSLFLQDGSGDRPIYGEDKRFSDDPRWRDLILFHEYFHGETGKGLGANHQTGWTALIARHLEDLAEARAR